MRAMSISVSPLCLRASASFCRSEEPKKYNYHFKHMTTVGEPIEPTVWQWYAGNVHQRFALVSTGQRFLLLVWCQLELPSQLRAARFGPFAALAGAGAY